MLNTSWRRVNKNSFTWWYVLKTSWRYLCKTSWRRCEDVLKMSWRRLENVLMTSCQEDLKTAWERLKDVWLRRIYWSWPRRLVDVLKMDKMTSWRRLGHFRLDANIFVLIQTFWRRLEDGDERRLQDVFKTTSSREMFAGKLF